MKKKKILVIKIIMFICVIGIILSLGNIILWYYENKQNNSIKEELNEFITTNTDTLDDTSNEYIIDFDILKEKNSDTVAYLKVNGTNIDYVVVKGSNNDYYLKHNFNKKYNRSGWIFMDYRDKFDGTDKNIIIYGHNTKDGSMFGTLRRVITKDWYTNKDNYFITLVNENKTTTYQVFSTYSISVEDYYIQTEFKNNDEYLKFLKKLTSRSVYNYHVDLNSDDHILTLSTCTGNGKKRMVLHAKELVMKND